MKLISPASWGPPLAIAAAGAFQCVHSWLKWPDVLVDYGQQLYVAWRLTEGQVLYRDVAYFHGPLSAYLNAGAMRLWGVSLLSLVFLNFLVLTVLLILIYKALLHLAGRFAATVACLVFVGLFAFAQYLRLGNYNYVSPYTSEITHGVTLALAAVYCMTRYGREGRVSMLALSGFLSGLVFLTKAEVFLATALALGTGLGTLFRHQRPAPRDVATRLTVFAGTTLVAPGLAFLLFCLAVPPVEALANVTAAFTALLRDGPSELAFYRSRMGLDAPRVNLARMLTTTSWQVLLLGPAVAAALLWKRATRWRVGLVVLAWGPVLFAASNVRSALWLQAGRAWPLLMVILIVACAVALEHDRSRRSAWGVLTMAVFALGLLLKILLNSRVYHYGFVLAMPATLLVVLTWLEWIPAWIERRGGHGGVFRAVGLALLGAAVTAHWLVSDQHLAQKSHLVSSGADAFWSDPRGQAVNTFLELFGQLDDHGATLVVVPDGVMLNYLARAPTPVAYLNYVPTEVFAYGEEQILTDLRRSPPDYVAIVEKSTAEFGYPYFGRDYARGLMQWIEANYETLGVIGAPPLTGRGFGIELLRWRDDV